VTTPGDLGYVRVRPYQKGVTPTTSRTATPEAIPAPLGAYRFQAQVHRAEKEVRVGVVEWVVEKGTEGAEAAPFFPAAVWRALAESAKVMPQSLAIAANTGAPPEAFAVSLGPESITYGDQTAKVKGPVIFRVEFAAQRCALWMEQAEGELCPLVELPSARLWVPFLELREGDEVTLVC
jgi:hypothetical protein